MTRQSCNAANLLEVVDRESTAREEEACAGFCYEKSMTAQNAQKLIFDFEKVIINCFYLFFTHREIGLQRHALKP